MFVIMSAADLTTKTQQQKDLEHLKLLSVFHFVLAGLTLVMIAFLFLHYLIMNAMFSNPQMWEVQGNKGGGPPPEFFAEFIKVFVWFYLFMGIIALAFGAANILSGVFIRQKKHRTFSLVVASLNCICMPFGTALGVFTLVVLLRESVQEEYGARVDRE